MKTFKLTVILTVAVLILPVAIVLLPDAPVYQPAALDMPSQKSTLMKAPQGHPDLYMEHYHAIRASENGEIEYPVGYRYKAIEEAYIASKNSSQAAAWVERGPGNVGGRTRAIVVDPDDPDMHTWWVGAVGGGLYKTINGGLNWKPQSENFPIMSVSVLTYAASNPDVMYAGTGEVSTNLDAVVGDGIFKSTDRGETWEHLASTAGNTDFIRVNRLAVDPQDPDVVVAATSFGIFRTTDGGMTWTESYSAATSVQDLRAQPGNFNMQIASENRRGILYSTDAGVTWNNATTVWLGGFNRVELAYSRSHPDIAYAAAETPATSNLYRSDDGGMNWVPTVEANSFNWMGGQGWYDNTLAVHPFDPSIVYVGGIQLWDNDVSTQNVTVRGPSNFDVSQVNPWMGFINFGASAHGGTVDYLPPEAVDVTELDYTNIEVRFGQGTQKAHRFTVSETGGTAGDGGAGIPFSEYMYADYVDVPFTVWDADNERQLMFSFRDQADNGEFNLLEWDANATDRNSWSREYMFIHKYDYDDANPHESIDEDGGHINGLLYFMWPILQTGATWDPANLPTDTLTLEFAVAQGLERVLAGARIDPGGLTHVDHHNLVPVVVDEAAEDFWMLNANDGGVAVSWDKGVNFQELDGAFRGFNTSQFYGVSKKPGSPVYIGGTQDNGTWLSFGNPNNLRGWRSALGADGFETVWHATDPNKVLASIQFTGIFRSENAGASFAPAGGLTLDGANGQFISTLGSSDEAPDYVYTTKREGVYVSDNFGESWSLVPITESWGFWSGGKARVSIADPTVVWAGYGMDSSPDRKMHVSTEQGASFSPVELPNVTRSPETVISGFATHPAESETAYALFSRYGYAKVLETKDLGQTWTDLSAYNAQGVSENGFPEIPTYDLVVMPHATHVIWVGTDAGIFTSRSSGNQWYYANNGLPAVAVWRMKVRDNEIVVGTHGRGVWTLPLAEVATDVDDPVAELPSGFSLAQNYPNPFNASTTIRFDVPSEAPVRLTVFDASGRKVAVLTDRVYAPGVHELNWNANDLASGMYFYRMETGGRIVHTRQMTLLK